MVPVSIVSWVPSAGAVEAAAPGRLAALAGPASKETTLKKAASERVKADIVAECVSGRKIARRQVEF
jgi:hypothetical protein